MTRRRDIIIATLISPSVFLISFVSLSFILPAHFCPSFQGEQTRLAQRDIWSLERDYVMHSL